ncbi:hypothetical protein RIF29_34549 [Crotalaria pallida]|uniref:Uncharacterized protein n=1 Tax=Crotalaria pallida TaxID=3830 RepID=A0AAN9E9I4_CROPI
MEADLLASNNQEGINLQDMNNSLESGSNPSIYGPWMLVQKFQRRRSNFPKANDKAETVTRGNWHENKSQSKPKDGKLIMKGSGSCYNALDVCNEELEVGLVNGPNEEAAGCLDMKDGVGPMSTIGKARVSKARINKELVNQRVRQSKPSSKEQPRKKNRFGPHMNNSHEIVTVAIQEDKDQEMRAAKQHKEQEIMRIMSRKQEEIWRDYKQGKNVDDFLGCVGVHVAAKELEFIKEHSVKEKIHTDSATMNTGLSVKEGMNNLVSSIANEMVAEATRNEGGTSNC